MRLLLAEDERSLSKALTAILEGNHYSVDAVYDGAEALAYLDAGNYDALILDIMMPKLDGLSVLRKLQASGNQIPVLMLTAKAEVDDKVLGLDSGANDYLAKPFAARELLARIRAMTRSQSVQNDVLLQVGNITLNCASFDPDRDVLLNLLASIRQIASELGIHINEKKTHIAKISSTYKFLQVKYSLSKDGKIIKRINPERVTAQRRKLKKLAVKVENGEIEYENVENMFKS